MNIDFSEWDLSINIENVTEIEKESKESADGLGCPKNKRQKLNHDDVLTDTENEV